MLFSASFKSTPAVLLALDPML